MVHSHYTSQFHTFQGNYSSKPFFSLLISVTWVGGGYFASLRARAASREPRASVCEPQKIPVKKSKNGHNALIWHFLHAGYFIYANTRGTFYQTAPTKGNRALTILIPFPNSLHKRSRTVNQFVKNGKGNFGVWSSEPVYSGQKKPLSSLSLLLPSRQIL